MCLCFESGEERAARTSLELLWNLPVVWFRDHDISTSPAAVAGLVGKLFSSAVRVTVSRTDESEYTMTREV